jgi:hypothetical protein
MDKLFLKTNRSFEELRFVKKLQQIDWPSKKIELWFLMWLEPILDLYLDYWKQMMVLKLINSTFHLLRFLDMPPQTQSKQAHL